MLVMPGLPLERGYKHGFILKVKANIDTHRAKSVK